VKLALRYDLRAPDFATPAAELYRAALEQCAWADGQGFDHVVLSEHHGAADGYCPSPAVLGAAIAGATTRLRIQLLVVVVTLHDPLRVAEDLAVLDLVSGGRLDVFLGAGYRPEEFAMFGRDMARRAELMETAVAVLEQAWTGEPFEHNGIEVRVTPRPCQRPRPPLFLGGQTKVAARRAARLADGFMPATPAPAVVEAYRAERERLGLDEGWIPGASGPLFLHVARDPGAAWARIAPHALHEANSYLEWVGGGPENVYSVLTDADSLLASGLYAVVTPAECVAMARAKGPDGQLTLHPLMGGLDPALAWESLELFAAEVLPELRGDAAA